MGLNDTKGFARGAGWPGTDDPESVRGLIGRPELLFLDEPTAGLDPQARRNFHDLLRSVAEDFEVTVLIATHDLAEAEKVADRIAILVSGRIIAEGTSEQLSRRIVSHDRVRWVRNGQR